MKITYLFLIPYKGMQISNLNVLVLFTFLFCFVFKKANNMCLLSEVNIRRLFFPSPVLCFCTKHKTDLILPYGDNQAALNTCEKETIFICHARWDAQLLNTWSCSPHRRTQSRAEMPSQWTILKCCEVDSRAATHPLGFQEANPKKYVW